MIYQTLSLRTNCGGAGSGVKYVRCIGVVESADK
jgi:hypothetical protein